MPKTLTRELVEVSEHEWTAMAPLEGVITVRDNPKVSHEERQQSGWTCLTPAAAAQTPHQRSLWVAPGKWAVFEAAWRKRQAEQDQAAEVQAWADAIVAAGWTVAVSIPRPKNRGVHRHAPDVMCWFAHQWSTVLLDAEVNVRTRFGIAVTHRSVEGWAAAFASTGELDHPAFLNVLRPGPRWQSVQDRWRVVLLPRWDLAAQQAPLRQRAAMGAWIVTQWAEVRWDDSNPLVGMERAFDAHSAGWAQRDHQDRYSRQASLNAIERLTNFERFEEHFPLARGRQRDWTFFMGPPNTGKTYRSFERLENASSGAYWAPLRLLALEGHETLLQRGVPNDLMTGEERRRTPGSRHTAATVEMANPNVAIKVAVLDEVQLWQDPDRGWAWTQALLGAPASQVVLTGAAAALPAVQHLAQHLGDALDVVPLEAGRILKRTLPVSDWRHVRPGDALIAFARRDVLAWKEAAENRGFKVSVVYGHLSPEVRQEEARRFREGESQLLIATNAIGLGLNLPIRRVIFTSLVRFDGEVARPLDPAETQQIAERAGRRGWAEDGEVTCWFEEDHAPLQTLLSTPVQPPKDLRWWVQPLPEQLLAWQGQLGGSLSHLLETFTQKMLIDHPVYKACPMPDARERAGYLGRLALPLVEQYAYARAPVDANDEDALELLLEWATGHARGRTVPWNSPQRFGRDVPGRDQRAELFSDERRLKVVTLYRWLTQRFPEVYTDVAGAEAEHAMLNHRIETLLHERVRHQEERGQGAGRRRYGTR